MITKIQGYKSSDGKMHASIEDAQASELFEIVVEVHRDSGIPIVDTDAKLIVDGLMRHRDKIIDILTTTPSSKPKARAINGGRKKRAARNEQTTMFQTATPAAPAA